MVAVAADVVNLVVEERRHAERAVNGAGLLLNDVVGVGVVFPHVVAVDQVDLSFLTRADQQVRMSDTPH